MAMQLEAAEAAVARPAIARGARAAVGMRGGGIRSAQADRIGHPVALRPAETCKRDPKDRYHFRTRGAPARCVRCGGAWPC